MSINHTLSSVLLRSLCITDSTQEESRDSKKYTGGTLQIYIYTYTCMLRPLLLLLYSSSRADRLRLASKYCHTPEVLCFRFLPTAVYKIVGSLAPATPVEAAEAAAADSAASAAAASAAAEPLVLETEPASTLGGSGDDGSAPRKGGRGGGAGSKEEEAGGGGGCGASTAGDGVARLEDAPTEAEAVTARAATASAAAAVACIVAAAVTSCAPAARDIVGEVAAPARAGASLLLRSCPCPLMAAAIAAGETGRRYTAATDSLVCGWAGGVWRGEGGDVVR